MINIIEEFRQYKNEENAEKQAAYLRHQFEFIGLKICLSVNFNIWL